MLSEAVNLEFLKEFQKMPSKMRHDVWMLRYGRKVVHIPDNGIKTFWVSVLKNAGLFHHQFFAEDQEDHFKLKERRES